MMIVVTGAAGFIGSNVLAALNDRGDTDLVACDRLGSEEKWINLRKRVLRDIVPPEALFTWLNEGKGVRAIIHMGANSSTMARDGDEILRKNFRFSLSILDWCASHNVPLIYASSAATYGNGDSGLDDGWSLKALKSLRPLNLYGWSKHLFDLEVANRIEKGAALPPACVGLKFFNVYGPNEYHKGTMGSVVTRLYEPAKRGESIQLFKSHRSGISDGEQQRDFVYVRDVVNVILWFLDRAGDIGIFNLGSGKARTFVDLIGSMYKAISMEPRITFIDMPEPLRARYQYFTEADLTRLRKVGYAYPTTGLEEGVDDFVTNYLMRDDRYR